MKTDVEFDYDLKPGCRCGSCWGADHTRIVVDRCDGEDFTEGQRKAIAAFVEDLLKDE